MATSIPDHECQLHNTKHITYWKRCLRTLLPHQYTSNDSNRMTLAFFIISALDLLGGEHITSVERNNYVEWIYHCQHPDGGFRGFPGTDFGDRSNNENKVWDPANLPATFFALATLLILGDDLERVQRYKCLRWLKTLQRSDGSFGETLGENARIEGGRDMRFTYCATGVRWILRGNDAVRIDGVGDIDVEMAVEYVRASEVRFSVLYVAISISKSDTCFRLTTVGYLKRRSMKPTVCIKH
jgi:geranylgeranyl transferase type-1 subunit beta